jgi:hypothetical protein
MRSSQRPQNFQHVRQFRPQLSVRRRLRFSGLLHQLRPQRYRVPGLVQHVGNGLTAIRFDDARYLVADQLVIIEAHGLKRYRPAAAGSCRANLSALIGSAVPYDLLVAKWDPVQRQHVRQAAAEYDRLERDEFLHLHHFGTATAYLLILDGKSYDSKAILGVAYQLATGRPLGNDDFSGGVGAGGAARSCAP